MITPLSAYGNFANHRRLARADRRRRPRGSAAADRHGERLRLARANQIESSWAPNPICALTGHINKCAFTKLSVALIGSHLVIESAVEDPTIVR